MRRRCGSFLVLLVFLGLGVGSSVGSGSRGFSSLSFVREEFLFCFGFWDDR